MVEIYRAGVLVIYRFAVLQMLFENVVEVRLFRWEPISCEHCMDMIVAETLMQVPSYIVKIARAMKF